MENRICEQKINDLLKCGGKIILDKSEGAGSFIARKIHIQRGHCQFKIGYIILNNQERVVQSICTCNNQYNCSNSVTWGLIPDNCKYKGK